MAATQSSARAVDDRRATALAILRLLFGEEFAQRFAIRLWDGTVIHAREGAARFTLVVNAPEALRAALLPPDQLGAGRAFVNGLLDCEGDIEAAVDLFERTFGSFQMRSLPSLLALVLRLPKPEHLDHLREANLRGRKHSLARDRAAIGFHYDQAIAFYRCFLDREMVYSCGYFDDGVETLDQAQMAKIDHTLRKLRLQAGEQLLDIGCGWGALVVRAAERYGARVLGVTLSQRQHEEASRRIAQVGISATARVELRDYRELRDEHPFDKIVSIGMFEHVGRSKLPEYFSTAYSLLRPGGLFLNHGISAPAGAHIGAGRAGFVERFVFPDGELVPISEALEISEEAGFEVRDVENLREHYARTCRAWVANLERNRTAAIEAADERTYRIWRLYMAGSAQGFATRRMGIHQSLLAKPCADGSVELPPTRRDIYA
ncbi:MAG: class I SAM-dependent methyltransferase [bacterium]|nr:class I SAM-dependent methyltransferase [bacterium]